MEMIFNELSILPLSNNKFDGNSKMERFSNSVAEARKKGFRKIRSYHSTHQINISENYTIHEWINNKDVPKNFRDILFGMIIQPFINEIDETIEERYINSNYYFENEEFGIEKQECIGLASAYLYETLSISFSSSALWDRHLLPILIETTNSNTTENVFNISKKESLEIEQIQKFVEDSGELDLKETKLKPNEKKVHLSDHHGKAELKALADRLKLNTYVLEMRSTNWGGNNFIRETYANGVVEIVLVNSQRKYALWVQTTGTNLRETKAIAKILKDQYS